MKIEPIGPYGLRITGHTGPVIPIGDVHGHPKTLDKLLRQLPDNALIVFVGDLIDRGPFSRQAVAIGKMKKYLCVRGNHEQMMIEASHHLKNKGDFDYHSAWLRGPVGGWDTLNSYQIEADGKRFLDQKAFFEDANWMRTLPVFIEFPEIKNSDGRYLVVSHSSAARGWDQRLSNDPNVFANPTLWSHLSSDWEGKQFMVPVDIKGVFNIFGHTPIPNGPFTGEHFAAIDGGIYSGNEEKKTLHAYQFPEGIVYSQRRVETGLVLETCEIEEGD